MNKYSREEEASLPEFNNAEQAISYFKEAHGEMFRFKSSDVIGDDIGEIHFYDLVLNEEEYQKGMDELRKGKAVSGFDFLLSYQVIEIFNDGRIHMIH